MPETQTSSVAEFALIVEDDPALAALYEAYLENTGITVKRVASASAARSIISDSPPAVILLDLILPDQHGHEFLNELRDQGVETPVIVVTSAGSIALAVESMRLGAYDFLVKPFSVERLRVTVRNAMELRRLKRIERQHVEDSARFEGFIGVSPAMQSIYRVIRDAAPSKATVFITGDSGTGKELAAEALHRLSPRAKKNFVALNCSAMPRDLVESELFGHVKGAFTGATTSREGIAVRADGGTLFLDEIGEMDLALQSKFLRFIQTGEYQPVGGDRNRVVDIRFVCATNRDPLSEISSGRFREDLYYRLNVVPLAMPGLRMRGSDIILIAKHYLQIFASEEGKHFDGFDPEVERRLLAYDWPGNVRQLLNTIRNIVVLGSGGVVTATMLPSHLASMNGSFVHEFGRAANRVPVAGCTATKDLPIRPLWQIERDAIEEALGVCENNVGRAAALLQIDASTIYRKRKEWSRLEAG